MNGHFRNLAGYGLTLLLAGSLASCGTEPLFRAFDGTVISPNGPEGAAVLELDGTFPEVVAPSGTQIFTHTSGGVTRVVLVLTNPGTLEFTVTADDVGEAPDVRVIEVADGSNGLRASLSGYHVEFAGVAQ